ncbi:hypothetical protein BIW11_09529 [Tropilaelaps mercedesae]|uniref:Uncharacterized protein n=1 Tax=Tropilaelaps mercedesae TaxID=418985 RepID=A0A1V9XJZ8_9ACAR|nr:hypothetical protein BIW11_09529 [Tropilaelaps mercedesae]
MAHCSRRKHDRDIEKNPLMEKHHHSEKNQRRRHTDLYGLLAGGDNHRHEFRSPGIVPLEAVPLDHPSLFSPVIGSDGVVSLFLQHDIMVQLHPSGAVRVVHRRSGATVGIASQAAGSALYAEHPCVAKMEYCADVVSLALEQVMRADVFAKITKRGCLFTTINHGLVYLVDSSGVKSTTESFVILNNETTKRYFYSGANYTPSDDDFTECESLISLSRNYTTNVGTIVWVIGGVRVKQSTDGAVNVHVVSRRPGSAVVGVSGAAGGSQTPESVASVPGVLGANTGSGSASSSVSSCGVPGGSSGGMLSQPSVPGSDAGSIGGQRVSLTVMPNGDINLKRDEDLTVSMRCPMGVMLGGTESSFKLLDLSRDRARLTCDRRGFHARNGSHVAGFDNEMRFRLE